jgi:hypothetical protein
VPDLRRVWHRHADVSVCPNLGAGASSAWDGSCMEHVVGERPRVRVRPRKRVNAFAIRSRRGPGASAGSSPTRSELPGRKDRSTRSCTARVQANRFQNAKCASSSEGAPVYSRNSGACCMSSSRGCFRRNSSDQSWAASSASQSRRNSVSTPPTADKSSWSNVRVMKKPRELESGSSPRCRANASHVGKSGRDRGSIHSSLPKAMRGTVR